MSQAVTPATAADVLLVLTHLPDQDSARKLATHLLEHRLAACVNILAPCRSLYRWNNALEETEEVPLLIKTSANGYQRVEHAILALHPYELPDIVAVPLDQGLPGYLGWVIKETRPED